MVLVDEDGPQPEETEVCPSVRRTRMLFLSSAVRAEKAESMAVRLIHVDAVRRLLWLVETIR